MTKYFLFIGPLDHLSRFKKNGYVQQNYNHKSRLEKLSIGDYVVFYASSVKHGENVPYRRFIAVGRVTDDTIKTVYSGDTKYYRMKVKFIKFKETSIDNKLKKLKFIKNKKYYGLYLISGFRELSKDDFITIIKDD
jgi:predicted RNA-binding protein with PUA-like domain